MEIIPSLCNHLHLLGILEAVYVRDRGRFADPFLCAFPELLIICEVGVFFLRFEVKDSDWLE